MQCFLGLDIGSAFSKGIIINEKEVLGSVFLPSGGEVRSTADKIRQHLIEKAGASSGDVRFTVSTGYGCRAVPFADDTRSDLFCHGKGIHHLCNGVRTAIDIGDMASKVFRIDGNGNLVNFLLSGKCAGGSGRVLQIISRVLRVSVDEIGKLSLTSKNRVDFNTGCAVFAESEAISRIAEGVAKEDLLAGIHRALAAQLNSLADRVGIEQDFALVGGGALNGGLVQSMRESCDFEVIVPDEPHLTAALGAALIARQNCG